MELKAYDQWHTYVSGVTSINHNHEQPRSYIQSMYLLLLFFVTLAHRGLSLQPHSRLSIFLMHTEA